MRYAISILFNMAAISKKQPQPLAAKKENQRVFSDKKTCKNRGVVGQDDAARFLIDVWGILFSCSLKIASFLNRPQNFMNQCL